MTSARLMTNRGVKSAKHGAAVRFARPGARGNARTRARRPQSADCEASSRAERYTACMQACARPEPPVRLPTCQRGPCGADAAHA